MFGVKSKREKIKLNIVCENRQMIELIYTRLYNTGCNLSQQNVQTSQR